MRAVLDASALLALVNAEPGADRVLASLDGAVMSAVNFAEVGSRLIDLGYDPYELDAELRLLGIEIIPFDDLAATRSTRLRDQTRPLGLSLGDRACLALAISEKATALTADRAWARLDLDCAIDVIR